MGKTPRFFSHLFTNDIGSAHHDWYHHPSIPRDTLTNYAETLELEPQTRWWFQTFLFSSQFRGNLGKWSKFTCAYFSNCLVETPPCNKNRTPKRPNQDLLRILAHVFGGWMHQCGWTEWVWLAMNGAVRVKASPFWPSGDVMKKGPLVV